MSVGEFLVEAVKLLVPPKHDDAAGQTRWRWVVFASLVSLSVTMCAHIAIACGYLPSVSSGFALEADQKQLSHRIDIIATVSIEHEIRDKAWKLCRENDHDRRFELNDDINRLQREYKSITGDWYTVPACDRL